MPVDPIAGYIPRSSAEHLDNVQLKLEAALNEGAPLDWDGRDKVLGSLALVMASLLGEIEQGSLSELAAALDRNNARGALLDAHAELFGAARRGATFSTATVTVQGSPGLTIPAGTRFSTEGSSPQVFQTLTAVTMASSSETLPVEAVVEGPVVVTTNALSRLVTPVAGLSILSSSASIPGVLVQQDDNLRLDILDLLRGYGLRTAGAIVNAVKNATPKVQTVSLIENDTAADMVVDTETVPSRHIAVVVFPNLSTADRELVARAIYATKAAGTGTTGDVAVTLALESGDKLVRFYEASARLVEVEVAATRRSGSPLTVEQVKSSIEEQITLHFAKFRPGEDITLLGIIGAISKATDVRSATALIDGATADLNVGFFEAATLNVLDVVVT